MKVISPCLVALLSVALTAAAQVPVSPASIKVGKVEVAAPTTPEFQISGGQNKRYRLGKWLELEVGYETEAEEIDELTFKYTVLLERKLLTGEVTYMNILKAKDHFAVMYVSPKSIEKLTGGKALTGSSIENVWVEVSRQGQVLGRASQKPGAVPNLPQVPGMVLTKDKTPFASLYFDRYEAMKPGR